MAKIIPISTAKLMLAAKKLPRKKKENMTHSTLNFKLRTESKNKQKNIETVN